MSSPWLSSSGVYQKLPLLPGTAAVQQAPGSFRNRLGNDFTRLNGTTTLFSHFQRKCDSPKWGQDETFLWLKHISWGPVKSGDKRDPWSSPGPQQLHQNLSLSGASPSRDLSPLLLLVDPQTTMDPGLIPQWPRPNRLPLGETQKHPEWALPHLWGEFLTDTLLVCVCGCFGMGEILHSSKFKYLRYPIWAG